MIFVNFSHHCICRSDPGILGEGGYIDVKKFFYVFGSKIFFFGDFIYITFSKNFGNP